MYQAENPPQTEKQLQRGGFDGGCEVGFAGRHTPAFDEVKQALEKAKEQAAEKGEKIRAIIGGYTVFVEPAGANVGLRYRWVFVSGGVRFYVHNNDKVAQPVRVKYCAEALIGQNFYAVHAVILEFLRSLGFVITEEKISRVDLQEKEYALVDWLTSHWFRILNETKVRGSENHQDILPLWRETDNFKSRDNYKIQNSQICLCICKSNSFRKRNACRFKV